MIRNPRNHPHTKPIDLDRLREMRLADETNEAIAKALGCGTALVSRLALRMGLPRRGIDPTQPLNTTALAVLYTTEKKSLDDLAKQVGCSRDYIKTRLLARGVKMHPAVRRHPDKAAECVRLRRQGLTFGEIAPLVGLTEGQVRGRCRKVLGPGKHGGSRR